MNQQRINPLGFCLLLMGAMVLGFAVRAWGLTTQVFSNDEIIDLLIARSDWSEITSLADGFPPLHHFILKLVLQWTESDMSGRWLCLAYGVVSVPIIGLLTRRIAGDLCGVLAAFALSISPMHVYFSQECRSYSLYFLATAFATWMFWRALQTGTAGAWIGFALAASIGGYVHYYFCFVLLAFAIIWFNQARVTGDWMPGLSAFLGMSVLQLPIFFLVGSDIACQQEMLQGNFKPAALGYTGWTLLSGYSLGPGTRELHTMGLGDAMRSILPWLPLVGGLVVGLVVSIVRASHPYRFELLTLFSLPILCASVLAAGFQLSDYNVRYVIPSLVPLTVLLAIAIGNLDRRFSASLLAVVLLVVSSASVFNRRFVERYQNEDARVAAKLIADYESEPNPVYCVAFYMQEAARYYLPKNYDVIPVPQVTGTAESLQHAVELINGREANFWIFYSREFHGDPDGALKQALIDSRSVELVGTCNGVEVYRGEAPLKTESLTPLQ